MTQNSQQMHRNYTCTDINLLWGYHRDLFRTKGASGEQGNIQVNYWLTVGKHQFKTNNIRLPEVDGHGLGVFLPLSTAMFISTRHSVSELLRSLLNWVLSTSTVLVEHIASGAGTVSSETTSLTSGIISWSVVLLAVLSTGFSSLSSLGVMGELGVEASLSSTSSVFIETVESLVGVVSFGSSSAYWNKIILKSQESVNIFA